MKSTAKLHDIGQSLWLDNITRTMLADGTLQGYIEELSVTGLTSNPTIFDKAISGGEAYDQHIIELSQNGHEPEQAFFELAIAAHEELSGEGIRSRVVSLPCWELFDRQDASYRDEVLPPHVTRRVSIEEASTLGWDRYVGFGGVKIGMHTFGSSAPLKDVQTKFGFSPDRVAAAARDLLKGDA